MFESIVVGTDGSDTARAAVTEAIELAEALGARVQVVSAYVQQRAHSGLHRAPRAGGYDTASDREFAEKALDDAAELASQAGVEATRHTRSGDPASAILEAAEETGADLIVVGNRGMTGAARFLLGSVPNKVSHAATCSVLIVRTS